MGDATKAYVRMAVRSARSPSTDNLADLSECTNHCIILRMFCLWGLPFLLQVTWRCTPIMRCMCALGQTCLFIVMMAPQ